MPGGCQLETIKSSEVVQKGLAESAAAAGGGAPDKGKGKAAAKEAPKAGKGGKKGEEPPPPPKEAVPLDVTLSNLSRLADVLTRLVTAETAEGDSPRLLPEEALSSAVRSLVGITQLPMPWDLKKIFSRALSHALGAVAAGTLTLESRRKMVRDAQALPCLLAIVSVAGTTQRVVILNIIRLPLDSRRGGCPTGSSPEDQTIRRTAEKAIHHLLVPLPAKETAPAGEAPEAAAAAPGAPSPAVTAPVAVDEDILTGSEGSAPYLPPEALLAALASDDAFTWQAALRVVARLCASDKGTSALGAGVVPTLVKIARCLEASPLPPSEGPPQTLAESQIASFPTRGLVIAASDALTAAAKCSNPAVEQAASSTDGTVASLTALLSQGPLTAAAALSCGHSRKDKSCLGDTSFDSALSVYTPDQWLWDLSGAQEGATPEAIVPRARVTRALAAIAQAEGPGAALVVEKATEALVELLALDVDVQGTRRSWEAFVPKDQALLHDQLRLELLDLFAAGAYRGPAPPADVKQNVLVGSLTAVASCQWPRCRGGGRG
jgi:hypothetical protein